MPNIMSTQQNIEEFETASEAFWRGNIEKLEALTAESNFPHGNDQWLGQYWLTHAIVARNLKSIEWVLSKGVDVHYEHQGFTALKDVLQVEDDCQVLGELSKPEAATLTIKMIDLLVKAGVDVNQRMNLDYTAMHSAALWSSVDVIRHLLQLGADPSFYSGDYVPSRPVDDAKFHKRWEVHAVLCEAMGLQPSGRPLPHED